MHKANSVELKSITGKEEKQSTNNAHKSIRKTPIRPLSSKSKKSKNNLGCVERAGQFTQHRQKNTLQLQSTIHIKSQKIPNQIIQPDLKSKQILTDNNKEFRGQELKVSQTGEASGEEDKHQNNNVIVSSTHTSISLKDAASKLLRRKFFLLGLNTLLTISSLLFLILTLTFRKTGQIQDFFKQVFELNSYIPVIICISVILILCIAFTILILKGKVLLLHCYWLSCLVLLLVFAMLSVSSYALSTDQCQKPSNYLFQKVRFASLAASSLYCSDTCACSAFSQNKTVYNNSAIYSSVLQCPGYEDGFYGTFFLFLQEHLKCSGWCHVNQDTYFIFATNTPIPSQPLRRPCYTAVMDQIVFEVVFVKIMCVVICTELLMVILTTNYYILMEKEDRNRTLRQTKKKIARTAKKMEQQLRSSRKMLQSGRLHEDFPGVDVNF